MAKTLKQLVADAIERKSTNAAIISATANVVEAQVSIEDAFTTSFAIQAAMKQGKRHGKVVLGRIGTSIASIKVIEN